MTQCIGGEPSPDRNEYADIDKALAERLKPLREYLEGEDILVRALPDLAAGFSDRTDSGDIYFVLSQGEANRDERTRVLLFETWQITLVVMLPNRYTKAGVYDVFKRARNLLVGFTPPYALKPIGAPDWRFNRDQAHWVIEATFPFDVYILDTSPDEEDEPTITELKIQGVSYTEVVTSAN